jgi:branched-chain amino acid aminotransferase
MKIWLNGKFINRNSLKVDILAHTLHYGTGVFEGIRCYKTKNGPAVFRLKEHIERLFSSAKYLNIKINFKKEDVVFAVLNTIKINKLEECYIRPLVFLNPQIKLDITSLEPNLAIITVPFPKYLGDNPVKAKISKFIRIHPQSVIPEAKVCGYYINSVLATMDAKKSGFEEAILLDYKGFVAEGPGENIFIVKNKTLYTPKLGSILPGITRKTVLELARDFKIKTIEKDIKPNELKKADEAFFTGTAAEITPIYKIDDVIIGNGKIGELTNFIKNNFQRIVSGEIKKYYKWLTFLN